MKDYADDYVRRLQASVAHIKTNREMEARYMLWRELINEEREEAKEEGRIEMLLELLNCPAIYLLIWKSVYVVQICRLAADLRLNTVQAVSEES